MGAGEGIQWHGSPLHNCSVGWVLLPLLLLLYTVVYLLTSGATGREHVHPQVGAGEGIKWHGSQLITIAYVFCRVGSITQRWANTLT